MDKIGLNLSVNLIGLRKKNKLTQEALAKLAGTTRSVITLLESGTANPTLEVLMKVSIALKTSIDELISTPMAECKHIKAKDIPLDKKSKNGVILRKLLPDKIRATEMDEILLDSYAVLKGSPHVEGTKEYFFCLEGPLIIGVLGKTFELKKGDLLAFPGEKNHYYKNPNKKKVRGMGVVLFNGQV